MSSIIEDDVRPARQPFSDIETGDTVHRVKKGRPLGSKNKPKADPAGTATPPPVRPSQPEPASVPQSGAVESAMAPQSPSEEFMGVITSDSVERPVDFVANDKRGGTRSKLPSGKSAGASRQGGRWFFLLRNR